MKIQIGILLVVVSFVLVFFFIKVVHAPSPKPANPQLSTVITNLIANNHSINFASVYVYEFKSKKVLKINNSRKYYPASIIKIVGMIAAYKIAQSDPSYLQQKITYQPTDIHPLSQNIKPSDQILPEKSYTLGELIERMIKYSDNVAADLVFPYVGSENLNKVFIAQGILPPDFSNIYYAMQTQQIASIFISLYVASYLNHAMAQKAIALLEHRDFKQGLLAGLPSSISVADKFGERKMINNNRQTIIEFHECGIVYSKDPYLLCVMTDGKDMSQQITLVKHISQLVYQELKDSSGKI